MKRTSNVFALFMAIVLLAQTLLFVGCNTTPSPTPTQAPTNTPKPTATATSTPAPTATPDYVYNIKDVRKATVRIKASGLPELNSNKSEGVGSGSGAIIDPSGLVLTNNHVVAGAQSLTIWVWRDDGTSETYTGKVIGVSECADLALVKIQSASGDVFPYLTWSDIPLEIGAKVYAAGFPGATEYTLTDGIISKDAGQGDTSWASVQSVIEHTAKINPGSSGGPLVDENGFLVGINFGSNSVTDQNLAISKATVDEIFPLLENNTADDMGISGIALADLQDEGWNYGGVLVTSVREDSMAAEAGLMPGDIIFLLGNSVPQENVSMAQLTELAQEKGLAQDGTMKEYCSILRDEIVQGDKVDVLALRPVYNPDTNSVAGTQTCRGTINGSPLECSGTAFAKVTFDKDSDLEHWSGFVMPSSNRGSVKTEIVNGQMQVTITGQDTYAYTIYDGIDTADVQIDVTAENKGAFYNAISIICRYSEDEKGKASWYEFNISSARLFYLMRYNNGGFLLLASGMSKELNYGMATNTYRVICNKDWLILYINGVEKIRTQDPWLKSGKVGLSASAFWDLNVVVGFDEFTVSPPEEE